MGFPFKMAWLQVMRLYGETDNNLTSTKKGGISLGKATALYNITCVRACVYIVRFLANLQNTMPFFVLYTHKSYTC